MLKYEDIKDKPRELLAASGLTAREFEGLLGEFCQEYTRVYSVDKTVEGTARKRRKGGGNKGGESEGARATSQQHHMRQLPPLRFLPPPRFPHAS